jgi:uncharacterized protein DUF5317
VTLVLLVAVLALALVAGRRAVGRLATLRVRAVRLLVVAAGLQISTAVLVPDSGWARSTSLVLSLLLVSLFLYGNHRLPGVPLIAAGLLLNATVILLNATMPVSVGAAARAGIAEHTLHLDDDPLHEPLNGSTRLGFLGDTVPVALPWRPQVVSPGDVLVAAGVGLLLVAGSAHRQPRPARRPRQAPKRVERSAVLDRDSTTRGSYS